ncbi:MAG: DUF86 domain-containing protein [Planctomycetes bacterium]|nr:DUF86 domain-containing protein [Planctomycetota bacterium]
MSRRDDTVSLRHMLDHAQEAMGLLAGRSRDDLEADRTLNLALVRLLEIVGEAAARVSPATRERLPAVPWSSIKGMRNRLIHAYDEVDFDIVWTVVQTEMPSLSEALRAAISQSESSGRAGTDA